MRVIVVCTGNVARSPALAEFLRFMRPDLSVESAGVGVKTRSGLRMKKPMRELLWSEEWCSQLAIQDHRSRRWDELEDPERIDLAVAVAPGHMKRLAILAPDVPRMITVPAIKDPAYGPAEGYLLTLVQIKLAVEWLAQEIPGRRE